ncbi:PREDICTED: 28S ribosomal protein S36, mitochondrial-like [Propithecus coquereli]|uniref:28S ribosomal protein S36, mitochondrial-like n=1 Tax=Propithecus coquereli TaxID=379532 RepID=UPI00063F4286|nr:PREDICTED: 28S ribosomal protein S36, mitochondrial-like [Propithecus coquereli]
MMGSKMVSASRIVQVVKPHTPLIRLPDRRDNPKPNVSEALRSAGLPSHSSAISQHSKRSKSSDLLMYQGPPDTAEIIKTLSQKYRRKLVSQEEIEFIQRERVKPRNQATRLKSPSSMVKVNTTVSASQLHPSPAFQGSNFT